MPETSSFDTFATNHWMCPICKKPLTKQDNTWRCINKHSFDRAKEGYVNLLLAQHKSSKDPGDNKEMVLARRAFLEQDFYLPLAQKMAELIHANQLPYFENNTVNPALAIFDAGCGEGYYLATIKQLLSEGKIRVLASGSDISKSAIQKAAKKHSDIDYAVASSFNLPVASNSQDIVIQVFAPSSATEIKRILKKDGLWIRVTPASQHLFELKEMVYDQAETHEQDEEVPAEFELRSMTHVQFEITLSKPAHRENLLKMTPFYWSISTEKKLTLLENLSIVSADFNIKILASLDH